VIKRLSVSLPQVKWYAHSAPGLRPTFSMPAHLSPSQDVPPFTTNSELLTTPSSDFPRGSHIHTNARATLNGLEPPPSSLTRGTCLCSSLSRARFPTSPLSKMAHRQMILPRQVCQCQVHPRRSLDRQKRTVGCLGSLAAQIGGGPNAMATNETMPCWLTADPSSKPKILYRCNCTVSRHPLYRFALFHWLAFIAFPLSSPRFCYLFLAFGQ
jgi:hypothetical protein